MDEALDKIRPHVKSALLNQSAPAKLLVAVESTLQEQGQEPTPVAYYASFLATLQETVKREESSSNEINIDEGAMVPSLLYLLSLVVPHVPHPVLRSNSSTILDTVAPLFPLIATSAPAVRSAIGIVASLIVSLDNHHLTSSSPILRQSYATILDLTIDPRPKVRKRAQEAITEIINSPPPPLQIHPYAKQTADFVIGILGAVAGSPGQQQGTEMGIWTCAFVKDIVDSWPPSHLDQLVEATLSLPTLSSPYLTSQAYALLSALLRSPSLSDSIPAQSVLNTLISYAPSHHTLAPSWLDAIENTMVAFARTDSGSCSSRLSAVWEATWAWLENEDVGCRKAAESALCAMVRYCIADSDILSAVEAAASSSAGNVDPSKKAKKASHANAALKTSTVGAIIVKLDESLHAVAYAKATPSLLSILVALISRLRLPVPTAAASASSKRVTAAEALVVHLIIYVGGLKIAKGFEYREQADEVLGTAIRVLGPRAVLSDGVLPLNIIPGSEGKPPPQPGRAFLLPLLAQYTTNTELGFFTEYFVPLSEKLFELKIKAEEAGRVNEAKVWEVLIAQVWGCFKGFCEACTDLKEAFTTPFARLITNLLYTQPSLRTSILQGLRTLLVVNLTLSQSLTSGMDDDSELSQMQEQAFGVSKEQAQENVTFLKSVSGNMISVLFNVFSSVASEERGLVGEVVKVWMGVLPPNEVKNVYNKITHMLNDALAKPSPPNPNTPPVSHTMLDLLLILLPHLPHQPTAQLFEQAVSDKWIASNDAGVQKRSWRVLGRLLEAGLLWKESGMKKEDVIERVVKRVSETGEKVAQGAQKDRIDLLAILVPLLSPSSQLHHIPALLPEAVLGTKEVSEKARNSAFDLLVVMGQKMCETGGVVKRGLVEGIAAMELDGDGSSNEVAASAEEFVTMVAAGLVGSTPHMISATITALSRLLFEFKDSLPASTQSELVTTVVVFLSSNNREIVKSAIGFVKLAVITLPVSLVQPHLTELVAGLLKWAHDHKNHFKTKVVHIFERMGRRFGWDEIMQCADDAAEQEDGVEDGRKVLEGVKKRKERAKKAKAKASAAREEEDEDGSDDEQAAPRATTGDAFQDVLYGSDSDHDDSDGDEDTPVASSSKNVKGRRSIAGSSRVGQQQQQQQASKNAKRSETRIRADDDDPMDLLHAGASHAVASDGKRRRQPGQDAAHFKTENDSGRIIIDDDTFKSNPKSLDPSDDVAGQAYREQMTSIDGFTRTPNGEVKFHKNTKKRRAEEAAAEALYGEGDVEMGDGDTIASLAAAAAQAKAKKKKTERVALGGEFKAKGAGGDVKRKGQQDPYAYLPLSSVGKKKGPGGHVKYNITGKR
ncbi:NUC173-domain-containing protein [Clavulina sp. PMI_390]|nr:NUC173-domain-containing protein [Clavulina sp. PMI_390]